LKQVAIEQGYPNRNQLIVLTLKKIIEDHQQAKNQDTA
jgi:metal-responsive CopG/Arc/MetJ family transcriptional regulator